MKVLAGLAYDKGPFTKHPIDCELHVAHYDTREPRIALQLMSQMEDAPEAGFVENLATCTVNFPDLPCEVNEVWVKDWAENEGMRDWLIEVQVIESTPVDQHPSGYVTAYRHRLTPWFVERIGAVLVESRSRR